RRFPIYFFHVTRQREVTRSFPTRRSSDLTAQQLVAGYPEGGDIGHRAAGTEGPQGDIRVVQPLLVEVVALAEDQFMHHPQHLALDRKSTRLNSSHVKISYAVFCLKEKTRR